MAFENFTNPFVDPANVPERYRSHPRLSKLFQRDGSYIRPLEDPVTLWAVDILYREYNVPLDAMELEIPIDFSRSVSGRIDLVIYDDRYRNSRGDLDVAFIALEAMEPNIALDSKGDLQSGEGHFDRLKAYVAGTASTRYAIFTNGKETRMYRRDLEYPRALQPIGDLSKYESAAEAAKHSPYTVVLKPDEPDGIITGLTPLTRDKFREVLGDTRSGCHSILRDNEGLQPQEAVDAMVKFLFAKWYDEQATVDLAKQTGEPRAYVFSVRKTTDPERLLVQVRETFEQAKKWEQDNLRQKYGEDLGVRLAFRESDVLMFKPHTTMQIVERLQPYSLRRSSADIKGGVFEDFLGKTFRDDLGQYFTPTPVINLMVGILQPTVNDFIGDPACGSARMLTHALDNIRKHEYEKAVAANGGKAEGINPEEPTHEFVRFRDNQLFGTEIAPNVMHVARLNTLMNGAQYADLKIMDSLAPLASITGGIMQGLPERPGFYPGGLTLILTNPPFGSKVTDKRVLDDLASRDGVAKSRGKVTKSLPQEVVFLNRCLEFLSPGGRMGIVLHDGVLANDSLQDVRDWILRWARLKAVVSLPQETFAPYGAGVKTSVIFLEKRERPLREGEEDSGTWTRYEYEFGSEGKAVLKPIVAEKADPVYRVYMSRVDSVGYDANGRLSVSEDQASLPPEIADTVVVYSSESKRDDDDNRFWVGSNNIAGSRFDWKFYNREYARLMEFLHRRYGAKLVTLKSVSYPITSGATPRGSTYVDTGVPFLRVQNILEDGSVDLENCLFVTPQFAKTIERAAIRDNDILLVIVGATIGKCGIVRDAKGLVVTNQAIAGIRLLEDSKLEPDYVQAFLASKTGQIQIETLKRPVAQGNLNLTETGHILIPILDGKIQGEVVAEITRRRAEAKRLRAEAERVVTEAKARVEQMILGEEMA
jgi:type I restriction enzyme M protein